MKTLVDTLKELKDRVEGVRTESRRLTTGYGSERAKRTAETMSKIRTEIGELKSHVHELIRSSRHWRTGSPYIAPLTEAASPTEVPYTYIASPTEVPSTTKVYEAPRKRKR